MKIVFDDSTLVQGDNASRSVTGVVFFDFDGVSFPCEGWSDFVVVVVTWWLEAVEKLERGMESDVVLRFMDGPYWITAARQGDSMALLRCIEDRSGAGVVHEQHVDLHALTELVRRLARRVASACARNGIESSDVDTLKRYLPN